MKYSINIAEFKEIPGFKNYFINVEGKIISKKRSFLKLMATYQDGNGNTIIRLERTKHKQVARLILETFDRPAKEGELATFIDKNRNNLHLNNLEWKPFKEAQKNKSKKSRMNTDDRIVLSEFKRNINDFSFQPIPGFDGYYASICGRIISTKRTKPSILKASSQYLGYLKVTLQENGKGKEHSVHSLILKAFKRERKPNEVIRHLDGNPQNNALSNLRYGSMSDNNADAKKHERLKVKLDQKLVLIIREEAKAKPVAAIARKYQLNRNTVRWAVTGVTWGEIKEGIIPEEQLIKYSSLSKAKKTEFSDLTTAIKNLRANISKAKKNIDRFASTPTKLAKYEKKHEALISEKNELELELERRLSLLS